jgi:hypothetical protein
MTTASKFASSLRTIIKDFNNWGESQLEAPLVISKSTSSDILKRDSSIRKKAATGEDLKLSRITITKTLDEVFIPLITNAKQKINNSTIANLEILAEELEFYIQLYNQLKTLENVSVNYVNFETNPTENVGLIIQGLFPNSTDYIYASSLLKITPNDNAPIFTVVFKDWNDTVLKTENVSIGNSATPPTNPTRTDYTFNGWDVSFTNVTQNLIVTALYTLIPVIPPVVNNVVLHLNGSLTDSSPNPKIINNFGAVLSNSQTKNNANSISVNGSQYLTAPVSNDFNFGTGDFTVELWLYLNSAPIGQYGNTLIDSRAYQSNNDGNYLLAIYPDLTLGIGSINGNQCKAVTPIPLNQWVHIAFCRSNGIINIFLNGNLDFTGSFPDNLIQSGDLKIMANAWRNNVPNLSPNCYFDNLKITKGLARYNTNFNP